MQYKMIDLQGFCNKDSILVALQKESNCPFEIKRVFYIFDVLPHRVRGQHANKNSEFLMICLNGSCKVKVDNGKKQEIFVLDSPQKGLYLGKMLWKEMFDFSQNCILLVLANTYYDKNEYIYDYEAYKNLMGGGVIHSLPYAA